MCANDTIIHQSTKKFPILFEESKALRVAYFLLKQMIDWPEALICCVQIHSPK